ncbi:MAG: hypothetical protein OXI41_14730 [Chloroflexota bacterium]|nr:hypothetical protein [Chloroflexota bacterium]MDE2895826.1 hypothetical protein [Chloroflexota bacterium]
MDPRRQLTLLAATMARDALTATGASEVSFEPPAANSLTATFNANNAVGVIAACPLFDLSALEADGATLARKVELEERLHAYGARDVALWVPPGAPLPDDADHAAGQVADAARSLEVGEKGEVTFKVDVAVRKTGSDGSYMSVLGGLSQQWARFTNQVMGEYQLDSSNVHRLPDDEQKVTQMVDFLVLVANGIRKEGSATTVQGEDTWRIQRIDGVEEPIVICAPPTSVADGRTVRRLMRRSLREAEEAIWETAGFRIAAMITLANSLDRELVTTALRGIDPLLVAGWDYMPLLVDGQSRALIEPSPPLI